MVDSSTMFDSHIISTFLNMASNFKKSWGDEEDEDDHKVRKIMEYQGDLQ